MREILKMIYSIFILAFTLFYVSSCSPDNKYSKKNHLFTELISDQLYSEAYGIDSYGVGGDVYSLYFTDSLNFRKFVSIYYDNESFEFKIEDDEVLIIKKEESGGINNPKFDKRVVEKYRFSLNELKEEKEFN